MKWCPWCGKRALFGRSLLCDACEYETEEKARRIAAEEGVVKWIKCHR